MVEFVVWLATLAPAYAGQGEFTHVSWEAVPSTRATENRWLHSVSYVRKRRATERVVCALKCSKLIEEMGGHVTRLELVPGWWEGVSNPSVQMSVTGLSRDEADFLSAAIGKALYQDGVGYHVVERVAKHRGEANILSVVLTRSVTAQDLAALQKSLDRRFGEKSSGVAMISRSKGISFLNVSGGDLSNDEVVAWAVESVGPVLGSKLNGDIGMFAGITGFQGGGDYESTLGRGGTSENLRRKVALFVESSRRLLALALPKREIRRWSRDAFQGLRDRLNRNRCLCLN